MKKIIATVLAMVMALALCTVSFADTKTMTLKDYKLLDMNNQVVTLPDTATLTYHSESKTTSTVDGKSTTTITPAYYELKVSDTDIRYAVVVAAENASGKLVSVADNKIVDYVYYANVANFDINKIKASDVVTKTIAGVEGAKCGEYEGKDLTFYVIDGKVYQACDYTSVDTKLALLNGKIVAYKDVETGKGLVEHRFTATSKTNSANGVITSIFCEKCEKYIPVTKTVPADSTAQYLAVKDADGSVVEAFKGYYYLADALGTDGTTTTTTTTTSPKTFDAGIAMYVGMALTSVAGSAVVIGKKKEF